MTKQQVIDRIDQRWSDLQQSLQNLTEEQMTRPGPDSNWPIKDILVHVRAWEEEALKYLPTIVESQRLPRYKDMYGSIDAFNAMTYDANKDLPLKTVLANLEDTHQRLLSFLYTTPEEYFKSGARFVRRLAADTFNHYPEHTEMISARRKK